MWKIPVVWKFKSEEPFLDHFKETRQVWMIKKMYSFISSIVPNLISGKTTQILFYFIIFTIKSYQKKEWTLNNKNRYCFSVILIRPQKLLLAILITLLTTLKTKKNNGEIIVIAFTVLRVSHSEKCWRLWSKKIWAGIFISFCVMSACFQFLVAIFCKWNIFFIQVTTFKTSV